MNDITQALKAAGVVLPPQNQRIWQWLKDNGPHNTRALVSELKIGDKTVQAHLTVMVRRKMLERIPMRDHKGKRLNNTYAALGRTYELKPEPKSGAAGRAAANAKKAVMPSEVVERVTSTFSPEQLLAACTLAELRQVHTFLRGIFK